MMLFGGVIVDKKNLLFENGMWSPSLIAELSLIETTVSSEMMCCLLALDRRATIQPAASKPTPSVQYLMQHDTG